jgi:hypothetical protein
LAFTSLIVHALSFIFFCFQVSAGSSARHRAPDTAIQKIQTQSLRLKFREGEGHFVRTGSRKIRTSAASDLTRRRQTTMPRIV